MTTKRIEYFGAKVLPLAGELEATREPVAAVR